MAVIIGFLVAGMFDSSIDVPRLTLLFYILLFAAFMPDTAVKPRGRSVGRA